MTPSPVNSALGVDLGEVSDHTALCTLRQVGDEFHCTLLDRRPLGTSYERIINGIKQIMAKDSYTDAALVVDATGVGRPVVERMEDEGLAPIPVVITGGVNEIHEPGDWAWRVPKKHLVTVLQIMFMRGMIKLPAEHSLAREVETELRNFKRKQNPVTMTDSFEAGRESVHDDIVLAMALSAWQVSKYYQPVQDTLAKAVTKSNWLVEQQMRDYEELQRRLTQTPEEIETQDWLDGRADAW